MSHKMLHFGTPMSPKNAEDFHKQYNSLWNVPTLDSTAQTFEERIKKEFKFNSDTQHKYNYLEYIKVINSYMYKEMCIFKPTSRVSIVMQIKENAPSIAHIDPFITANIRSTHDYVHYNENMEFAHFMTPIGKAVFVLVPNKVNPFHLYKEEMTAKARNDLYNYSVKCALAAGDHNRALELARTAYLMPHCTLSKLNQARFKLIGLSLPAYTTSWDMAARDAHSKSVRFSQRYGYQRP